MTSYISYLTSIKELYKLNNNELDALYNNLNIEQNNNLTLDNLTKCKNYINQLLKQQTILKNKIPQDKYNNINSFLINVVNNNNIIEEKINNVNRNSNSNSNRNSNINIDRIFDMKSINDFSIQNKNLNENFNSNINRENFNKNTKLKTEYNNTLEKENINPYKLYGFKKNEKFTLDELKSKYKKYAIQTHPDKNNDMVIGSTAPHYSASKVFQLLLAGKPILGYFHPASEGLEILQDCAADSYFSPYLSEDETARKAELRSNLLKLLAKPVDWTPNLEPLNRHSSASAARKLVNTFESCL